MKDLIKLILIMSMIYLVHNSCTIGTDYCSSTYTNCFSPTPTCSNIIPAGTIYIIKHSSYPDYYCYNTILSCSYTFHYIHDGITYCMNDCHNLFKYTYGKMCYDNCPDPLKNPASSGDECICKYRKASSGKCLNEDEPCPNGYRHINPTSQECLADCSSFTTGTTRRQIMIGSVIHYECINLITCPSGEFLYEEGSQKTCYSKCPAMYPYTDYKTNNCRKDCTGTNHYRDAINFVCYDMCPGAGYNIPIESTSNVFKYGYCIQESTCPSSHPYLYKATKTCFKTCPSSPSSSGDMKTNLYTNEDDKTCVASCNPYYLDGTKCVKDCGTKKNRKAGYECNSNCDASEKYVVDLNECVSSVTGYILDKDNTNQYYSKCPKYLTTDSPSQCSANCESGELKDEENKKCTACTGDGNFRVENGSTDKRCYKKCPSTKPYYYDANSSSPSKYQCYEKGNTAFSGKYLKVDSYEYITCTGSAKIFNSICYPTGCPERTKSITSGSGGSPISTDTCFCLYRYLYIDGVITCLGPLENCPRELPYIDKNKCVASAAYCSSSTYFKKLNTVPENIECGVTCSVTDGFIDGSYCVEKCPENKPYHNLNANICLDKCIYSTFVFADPINKICYEKCPGKNTREEKYSDGTTTMFKCILTENCPAAYPYLYNYLYESKICLSSCSKTDVDSIFLSSELSDSDPVKKLKQKTHLNVPTSECIIDSTSTLCTHGTYHDYVNNKCVLECDNILVKARVGNELVCYSNCYSVKDSTGADSHKYVPVNGTMLCAENTNCDGIYYKIENTATNCYLSCPPGYYQEDGDPKCRTESCAGGSKERTFINQRTGKCTKCVDILNPGSYLGENTGYYINGAIPQICYDKCPETAPYYDGNNNCITKCTGSHQCHKDGDNKCIDCSDSSCNYRFNYVCYTTCPPNTYANSRTCDCLDKYIKIRDSDNQDWYTCIPSGLNCPVTHPYILGLGGKQCTDTSCINTVSNHYYRQISSDPINYECLTSCQPNEYIYEDPITNYEYCVVKCPEMYPYHSAEATDTNKNCMKDCSGTSSNNKLYYTDNKDYVCRETCPDRNTINEADPSKKGYCIYGNACPSEYPYYYASMKTCVSDCSFTSKPTFSDYTKVTTKLKVGTKECDSSGSCGADFEDMGNGGACVSSCTTSQYKDTTNKKCYKEPTDCPNYFIDELTRRECVSTCPSVNLYVIDSTITGLTARESKKCYTSCPSQYYQDDTNHKCSLTCPDSPYTFKKESKRKCVKCTFPTDPNTPLETEGFKDSDYLSFCIDKCPETKPFFNYQNGVALASQDNSCKSKCVTPNYKLLEGTNKCYYTCPTGTYLFNFVCYQNGCPVNTEKDTSTTCKCSFKYYESKNGDGETIYNCLKPNEPCPSELHYYDKGSNKCMSSCSTSGKKIEKTIQTDPINIECLPSCNGEGEFSYTASGSSTEECVSKCPEEKPYHVFNGHQCYENCDKAEQAVSYGSIYFQDEQNKICYLDRTDCPGLNSVIEKVAGSSVKNGKCLTDKECPEGTYFYDVTNSCIADCKYTNYGNFMTPPTKAKSYADKDLKKCIRSCPVGQVLNNAETGCIDKCPSGEKIQSGKCVGHCSTATPYYVAIYDTNTCTGASSCPNTDPYSMFSSDEYCYKKCPSTYYTDFSSKNCMTDTECRGKDSRYLKNSNQGCVECSIPTDPNNLLNIQGFISSVNTDKNCYDECPGETFYIDESNTCYPKGNSNLNTYYIEGTKRYTKATTNKNSDDCPHGYFLFNKICYKDKCPENTQYDTVKKICRCSYKFSLTNGIYNCFSIGEPCNSTDFFFDTELGCVHKCDDTGHTNKKVVQASTSTLSYSANYLCVEKCEYPYLYQYKEEFIYTSTDKHDMNTCVEKCPEGTFHDFQKTECKNSCDNTKDIMIDNSSFICYNKDNCPYVKVYNKADLTKAGQCLASNECPAGYKLYKESSTSRVCLTDCANTKPASTTSGWYYYFGTGVETYLLKGSVDQCVQSCENTGKNLIKSDKTECVEKCGFGEYICKGICTSANCDTCDGGNKKNYNVDTLVCLANCGGYKTILSEGATPKKCYPKCPDRDPIDNITKLYTKGDLCVQCTNKGTYASNNQYGFISYDENDRTCYEKCPDNSRHNDGDNHCFKNNCSDPYFYETLNDHTCYKDGCPADDYYTFNYRCYYHEATATRTCIDSGYNIIDPASGSTYCQCKSKYYNDTTNPSKQILVCLGDNEDCPPGKPYVINKQCVSKCPDNLYEDDYHKMCTQCDGSDTAYKVKKESLKKCISTCLIPENQNSLRVEEGFKDSSGKKCLDFCPDSERYYDSGDNQCRSTGCTGTKKLRIENSYECISNCPTGYFLFNGICYKDKCPPNTKQNYTIDTNNPNQCTCEYLYYVDTTGLEICLEKDEPCPEASPFFGESSVTNTITNKCRTLANSNCPNTLYLKTITSDNSNIINFQCMKECTGFYYTDKVQEKDFKICVEKCPNTKPYHSFDKKECLASCPAAGTTSSHVTSDPSSFIDLTENVCYTTCPGLVAIDEVELNKGYLKGNCLKEDKCPIGTQRYYYEHNNPHIKACISGCNSITNDAHLANKRETYKHYEVDENDPSNGFYKCVTDCSEMPKLKYSDTKNHECVEKCGDNGGYEYLYQGKCYEKCSSASSSLKYYTTDTKECFASGCPSGYFEEVITASTEYACHKTCPLADKSGKELFQDTKNNKCIYCTSSGEYYVRDDTSPKTCYVGGCPNSAKYHDKGSNICFSGSCLDSNQNPNPLMLYTKYSESKTEYECHSSCSSVYSPSTWNNYRTEDYQCLTGTTCPRDYPFEYNKICYKLKCPQEGMKTTAIPYPSTGTVQYYTYKCEITCTDTNFYFIQGEECASTCNKDKYPYFVNKVTSGANKHPGICLTADEKCSISGYQFFNINDKECKDSCTEKIIEFDINTGKSFVSSKGTCLSTCPADFPYEASNVCYKNGCPASAPFYTDDNPTKCLTDCGNTYFEYDDHVCVKTCEHTDKPYFVTVNTRKKCYTNCPDHKKYFWANTRECTNQCKTGDYYDFYNPKTFECVSDCKKVPGYEYILDTDKIPSSRTSNHIACIASCPGNYPYIDDSTKICNNKCDYFISSENPFKCIIKCAENEKILANTKQCSKECNGNFPYLVSINSAGVTSNTCYTKCNGNNGSDGTHSPSAYVYLVEKTNQCLIACPSTEPFILNSICYKECPKDFAFYNNNKKCYNTCSYPSSTQQYHLKDKTECLNDCPSTQPFVIENTNTCLTECPPEAPNYYVSGNHKVCSYHCPSGYLLYGNECFTDTNCDGVTKKKGFKVKDTSTCYSECPSSYPYYTDTKGTGGGQYAISYVCEDQCDNFVSPTNECVAKCPKEAPFIGNGNRCKAQCEENDGLLYYIQNSATYNTYYCSKVCTTSYPYRKINSTFCIDACDANAPYLTPDKICVPICKDMEAYPFSVSTTDATPKYTCESSCSSTKPYYILSDKICLTSCTSPTGIINQYNQCVQSCNLTSQFKFLKSVSGSDSCTVACSSTDYYSEDNYICSSSCSSQGNHRLGQICVKSCDKKSDHPFEYKQSDGQIDCLSSCPTVSSSNFYTIKKYYYGTEKVCQSSCDGTGDNIDYVIQDTTECVKTCKGLTETPFFFTPPSGSSYPPKSCVRKCTGSKPYTLPNNTCTSNCKDSDYKYYKDSDKLCLEKCPEGFSFEEVTGKGYKCITKCSGTNLYLLDGQCQSSTCVSKNKYYFKSDNVCLDSCGDGFYSDNYECVELCPSTKPYEEHKICQDYCSTSTPYYIKSIKITDSDQQRHCLLDCPADYPFYVGAVTHHTSPVYTNYECISECPPDYPYYYVKNGRNAKECVKDCKATLLNENNEPLVYIGDNNECLVKCPTQKPYILEGITQNIRCYEKCPMDLGYQFLNGVEEFDNDNSQAKSNNNYYYICRQACSNSEKIYFEKNLCLKKCYNKQYIYKFSASKEYCLDSCSKDSGFFITPEGECVKECPSSSLYLVANETSNNCVCQNLYYYNDTGYLTCIDPTKKTCPTSSPDVQFMKENSKECVKYCLTVLSVNGVCLDSPKCPENSVETDTGDSKGTKICKCKYKYYSDSEKGIICLGKNESCPYSYNYLIRETNECRKACDTAPYIYHFDKYCMKSCPSDTYDIATNFCECKKKWYKDSNGDKVCIDVNDCPSDTIPVDDGITTKECVYKCNGIYKIFYNGKCISKCPTDTSIIQLKDDQSLKNYADYSCHCNNGFVWYFDELTRTELCSSSAQTCSTLKGTNYKVVKDTNECVLICPDKYPYRFNDECFSDCENDVRNYYPNSNVKAISDHECGCKGIYKIDSVTGKTVCLSEKYCENGYILYVDENICKSGTECLPNYYLFNNKCYSKDNPPENAHFDYDKFVCDGLYYQTWVKVDETNYKQEIHCMNSTITECPNSHKYLVNLTKECFMEENITTGFILNDVIYNELPSNTDEVPVSGKNYKICKCSQLKPWYSDENNKYYLTCGLEKCPDKKPFMVDGTNECLENCKLKTGLFKFQNQCLNDCLNNKIGRLILKAGTNDECVYRDFDGVTNLEQLVERVQQDIVRFYEEGPVGGYLYSDYNASIQVVGIDKNVNQYKQYIMKSNLTYIDFSKCINSIYETNKKKNILNETDPFILLKVDIINITNSSLVNPVEYEAYSIYGKKIDLSVCDINTIRVSYPINYRFEDYETISDKGVKNDIQTLFKIGKKLYEDDKDIDTFNHENEIYHDKCTSCEVDGKDLILRERGNYLYPNVSLCEEKCVYESTDFKTERINCLCPYKTSLNVQRIQNTNKYNFSKTQIDDEQKGPTTFSTFTCFKNFRVKGNTVFGYCVVAFAAQVALTALSSTIGITSLVSSITSKISGIAQNLGNATKNNVVNIETENKNLASSANPSNPPPKDGESETDTQKNFKPRPSEPYFKGVIDMPNFKNKEENTDYILNETTEFIPPSYCKMFFSFKDNGVVKEVKRSQIPFRVRKQTKYLYEPIPGATYKPKFYNPTSLKQNMVRIIDDEVDNAIEEIKDISPDSKGNNYINKEDNKNVNNNPKTNTTTNNNIPNKNKTSVQNPLIDNQNTKPAETKNNPINVKQNPLPTNQPSASQDRPNKDTLLINKSNNNNNNNRNSVSGRRQISNTERKPLANDENPIETNDKEAIDIRKYKEKRGNYNYGGDLDYDKESVADSLDSWKKTTLYENEDVLHLMKKEERLKDLPYVEAIRKDDIHLIIMILTFISDKIYLIKTLIFLKKYEIFSAFFSLYLLCHVMLFTLTTFFFDLDTLSKIFNENDYPKLGFYLLTGIYTNLMVWVVYRLLLCLLKNNNRIVNLIGEHDHEVKKRENDDNNDNLANALSQEKAQKLISYIKKKLIIFYILQSILTIFCCLYLILFSSVYTGSKKKIFKAYGIAILEIIIIKVVYAILLALFRKLSLSCKSECFYKFIKFFDVHLS